LLAALVIPGPGEALGGFGEVGCCGVDVAGVPGAAHGHIRKLAATAVVEDVGDFDCRGWARMSGDGVAVGEAVGADVSSPICSWRPSGVTAVSIWASGSTAVTRAACEVTRRRSVQGQE